MNQTARPQQWLASGLFLGSILTLSVIVLIPQPEADALTYLGLGAGLLLGLASFATFLNLQLARALSRDELDETAVGTAFRQGVEVAFLVVGALFLRAFNGLSWYEVGFLAASIFFAELALSLRKHPFRT